MVHDHIRDSYPTLSRSYRKVADYILANPFDVAFMTATQLAAAVEVNTTTVVRFAQALGYTGYPHLLDAIRQRVRTEIQGHLVDGAATLAGDESATTRLRAWLGAQADALAQLFAQNPPQEIEAAATLLAAARRFFLFGEGDAAPVAALVARQLAQLGHPAFVVGGDVTQRAVVLAQLGAGDRAGDLAVALGASSPGGEMDLALTFVRNLGCPVLAVVTDLGGGLNGAGDRVIHAPDGDGGHLLAVLAVISGLIQTSVAPVDGPVGQAALFLRG